MAKLVTLVLWITHNCCCDGMFSALRSALKGKGFCFSTLPYPTLSSSFHSNHAALFPCDWSNVIDHVHRRVFPTIAPQLQLSEFLADDLNRCCEHEHTGNRREKTWSEHHPVKRSLQAEQENNSVEFHPIRQGSLCYMFVFDITTTSKRKVLERVSKRLAEIDQRDWNRGSTVEIEMWSKECRCIFVWLPTFCNENNLPSNTKEAFHHLDNLLSGRRELCMSLWGDKCYNWICDIGQFSRIARYDNLKSPFE